MAKVKFTKGELLKRYLDNTISTTEAEELFAWLKDASFEDNSEVEQIMANYYQNSFTDAATIATQRGRDQLEQLLKKINADQEKQAAPVKHMNNKWWLAAASIIILLGVGSYFIFFNNAQPNNNMAKTLPAIPKDIEAPKQNRAVITLSNGQQVSIDSLTSGQLAMQGNMLITKNSNGEIIYSGTENNGAMAYNTLFNPRGSKVQTITLADGTQVWLNAESSLRYPVAFSGKDRKVEITGEAYFEVAHNAQMPFYVASNDVSVKVLGTHFNVNAYEDESLLKITLLEGLVNVSKGSTALKLTPGQQAEIGTSISLNKDCNTEEVMAWKNGFFAFRHSDLNVILKQLSRWYAIDVDYKGSGKKQEFSGKIDRNLGLSEVLKILERTGVHFKIEGGKRLTILN